MITVAQVLDALEITQADVTIDLEALIDRTTATVGRELNRYLGKPAEQVEVRDGGRRGGPGARFVLLHHDPVPGRPVTVHQRGWVGDPWEVVPSTDYALAGRQLHALAAWPAGPKTVQITYEAGFIPSEAPKELQDLVLRLVVDAWEWHQPGDGVQSETLGDYSYKLADFTRAASGDWAGFLRKWRRMPV